MPDPASPYRSPRAPVAARPGAVSGAARGVWPPWPGPLLRAMARDARRQPGALALASLALAGGPLLFSVPVGMLQSAAVLAGGEVLGGGIGGPLWVGLAVLATLAQAAVQGLVLLASARVSLRLARGQRLRAVDLLPPSAAVAGRAVVAHFAVVVVVALGLALAVVPGLVLAAGLLFWPHALLDGHDGRLGLDALAASWRQSRGGRGLLVGWLAIAVAAVALAGALSWGLGLVGVVPLLALATANAHIGASGASRAGP